MFSLIYAWINAWVNNREVGDLRRQFKYVHGLASHYLCDGVMMHVDIHGYDTSAENMDLYLPWMLLKGNL